MARAGSVGGAVAVACLCASVAGFAVPGSAPLRGIARPAHAALGLRGARVSARPPVGPTMQVASGATRSGRGVNSGDPLPNISLGDTRTPEEIVKEGRELVQEGIEVLLKTPPQIGLRRTLLASRAVLRTAVDVANKFQGRTDMLTQEDLERELPSTLRLLFERLGPTYIKLGQFIASSPTLFPAAYVEEFQKCLDATEKVPFARIRSIVQAELGSRRVEDVFEYIQEEPLATASIAQVHAARLKSTGEDVVIKVQKPGVGDVLGVDLSFLLMATKTLEFLNPEIRRLSIGNIASDIRTTMLDELDFRKEADNMDDFRAFLTASNIDNVVCPFVYRAESSKRLLTMQRLYGKPLTDLEAIAAYASNPEETLLSALNTWMASVVACKSFHADVHAGNLLVLESGKVGFIDFGIVGTISPKTWAAVEGLARGLADQDYLLMAKALVQLGATSDEVDTPAFAEDLRKLVNRVEALDVDVMIAAERGVGGETSVSAQVAADDQEVTRILVDLVALGQQYGIKFPRDFGLLLKQVLYFDRYTKLLAPTLEPLNDDRLRGSIEALAREGGEVTDVEAR